MAISFKKKKDWKYTLYISAENYHTVSHVKVNRLYFDMTDSNTSGNVTD